MPLVKLQPKINELLNLLDIETHSFCARLPAIVVGLNLLVAAHSLMFIPVTGIDAEEVGADRRCGLEYPLSCFLECHNRLRVFVGHHLPVLGACYFELEHTFDVGLIEAGEDSVSVV
jgi:hypothetical protein